MPSAPAPVSWINSSGENWGLDPHVAKEKDGEPENRRSCTSSTSRRVEEYVSPSRRGRASHRRAGRQWPKRQRRRAFVPGGSAPVRPMNDLMAEARGQKVLLDADLAHLYGVSAKRLNEQVRRNMERFPDDFMFRLAAEEAANLRSQIATSSSWGGRRYQPMAFTEQGVAMLSSVPRSLAPLRSTWRSCGHSSGCGACWSPMPRDSCKSQRIGSGDSDDMRPRNDGQFRAVFEAIRELMTPARKPGKRIGLQVVPPHDASGSR